MVAFASTTSQMIRALTAPPRALSCVIDVLTRHEPVFFWVSLGPMMIHPVRGGNAESESRLFVREEATPERSRFAAPWPDAHVGS